MHVGALRPMHQPLALGAAVHGHGSEALLSPSTPAGCHWRGPAISRMLIREVQGSCLFFDQLPLDSACVGLGVVLGFCNNSAQVTCLQDENERTSFGRVALYSLLKAAAKRFVENRYPRVQ